VATSERGHRREDGKSAHEAGVHRKRARVKGKARRGDGQAPGAHQYRTALSWLKTALGYQESFDIISREFTLAGHDAALIYIDSFVDQTVMTLLLERLIREGAAADGREMSLETVLSHLVPFIEVTVPKDLESVRDQVLAGPAALLVDGVEKALVIDARTYPDRTPDEPNLERVIRGPRDGFIETLVMNVILIRRRIRDGRLRVEALQAGVRTKTDIALLYLKDVANPEFVRRVRDRIKSINVDGLTMSEKALEEWIMKKPWWNPFPNSRFTERPDVAAEHLLQGHVLVISDTSPNALILPVTLFSFLQSAEEYHEGIMVGTYLKVVRTLAVLFSLVGPPLWFAMVISHVHLGGGFGVLVKPKVVHPPILVQLLLAEVGVDVLRLALMFSPNSLSQAMGFLGAILLGSIAVNAGLIDPEVMVYVALAAVGTFAAPDFDFGMAIRVLRMALLVLTAVFSIWSVPWLGFGLGLVVVVALVFSLNTLGISYAWPLWPPDLPELATVLVRKPANRNVWRPSLTLPIERRRRKGNGG
jgi:stage V sporulation protein AF